MRRQAVAMEVRAPLPTQPNDIKGGPSDTVEVVLVDDNGEANAFRAKTFGTGQNALTFA